MGSEENHKNSVLNVVLCGSKTHQVCCPSTPLGPLPPRPPISIVISHEKCDQLMRPRAAASIECLCARGGESTGARLLRGMLRFEALGVGVRRKVILVDA